MTHQALARKWRPRDFESLVGQEHVVRALTHALDTGRLHHAYLFTGTRGVGKTTIARILAKALNCETGVSARPCGICAACTGIDTGRFVDCLELDAASNRGVEEMTQLLENAVYAPTVGRYKVYVIDEVHMLSNHAFNAMLKTLEEPPPHVVFVLATTDPHKVPVTVLSRCLQFSLKNMAPSTVAAHLERVLEAENIGYQRGALALIGRAAAGSMRDALSVLDQAISFGAGELSEAAVREMLGVVDRAYLERIVGALADRDGVALVAQADAMLEINTPFDAALSELALLLQRIALVQAGVPAPGDDSALLERLAARLAPEEIQVHYQIAVHAQRDLPLAPDPHTGFTMTLLRMLAFRPDDGLAPPARSVGAARAPAAAAAGPGTPAVEASAARAPARAPESASARACAGAALAPQAASAHASDSATARGSAASSAARSSSSGPAREALRAALRRPAPSDDRAPGQPADPVAPSARPGAAAAPNAAGTAHFDGDWPALVARVRAGGMAAQFLQQSELLGHQELHFRLRVPIRPLAEAATVKRARDLLAAHFGRDVRLSVEVGAVAGPTAAAAAHQRRSDDQASAQAAIEADPFVQTLLNEFGGTIVPGSVRPAAGNRPPGEMNA